MHLTQHDVTTRGRGVHIFAAHILFTTVIYLFYFFPLPPSESGVRGHLRDVINAGGEAGERQCPNTASNHAQSRSPAPHNRHRGNNSPALLLILNIGFPSPAGSISCGGSSRWRAELRASVRPAVQCSQPRGNKRRRTRCNVRSGGVREVHSHWERG